jgi:hypothetical protein
MLKDDESGIVSVRIRKKESWLQGNDLDRP